MRSNKQGAHIPPQGTPKAQKQNVKRDKVKEIDYFRKVKKFFQCVERGSVSDEKTLMRLLNAEGRSPTSHGVAREDPMHLINAKNVFGQTPLYVACKHGNMAIVRFLIY